MYKDRRDQSEGVKAQRRFSGLTKGSRSEMPFPPAQGDGLNLSNTDR
jgi:hypothetical protein